MVIQEILQHYTQAKNAHILMMFKGGLSQNIMVDLGSLLQNRLGFELRVRKMFSIFVEMAQNIKNYSAETEIASDGMEVGIGILLLSETETDYCINSGNLVKNENTPSLKSQCTYLQSLDKAALKAYREERLETDPPPGSKGAGLGLIDITIKSDGNITFEFEPYDDNFTFFSITASVAR